MPKGDLVMVKVAEPEVKTTGGIILPDSVRKRPTSGDVVAVGDGHTAERTVKMTLKAGDTVLYSKFGIGSIDLTWQVRVSRRPPATLPLHHALPTGFAR